MARRTSNMIRRLPDAGAIILVPTKEVGIEVSRIILDLRGPEFDARCETLVITHIDDLQKLRGRRRFLAADHTFDRFAGRDLIAYIKAWIAAWNERWRQSAKSSPSGAA